MSKEKEYLDREEDEVEDDEEEAEDVDQAVFIERKRTALFALPLSLTKYTISPSVVTIDVGLLRITEDDCYMYKIQDVKLTRSLTERIFGLGTIICYTGDNTDQTLKLEHVRHAKEIKNYLLKQSEIARIRRRTLSTQDISARFLDADGNGIPDFME